MAIKPLLWLGSSRRAVRAFPKDTRQVVGHELFQVQQGLAPSSWKPMPTVGAGAIELRVDMGGAFRVLYVAKFEEGICVLHAFQKRTRRTAEVDIELDRKRLRDLEQQRRRRR
ncbi:MAG: type II toxin-antitoxin system RelE/ParE family toxin [Gemmatimonadetes bacterium]|nr:type II toxin-antitoxin system RelE/ParE family toxin [Gemmatimonadota bacterium]